MVLNVTLDAIIGELGFQAAATLMCFSGSNIYLDRSSTGGNNQWLGFGGRLAKSAVSSHWPEISEVRVKGPGLAHSVISV